MIGSRCVFVFDVPVSDFKAMTVTSLSSSKGIHLFKSMNDNFGTANSNVHSNENRLTYFCLPLGFYYRQKGHGGEKGNSPEKPRQPC